MLQVTLTSGEERVGEWVRRVFGHGQCAQSSPGP
jgi:hypothetical protein